jgi:hypothetical protein
MTTDKPSSAIMFLPTQSVATLQNDQHASHLFYRFSEKVPEIADHGNAHQAFNVALVPKWMPRPRNPP